MTREEAKEVFLNRGFIDGIYNGDKWREACVVISKWLEQEPTTKNGLGVDAVSREEVLWLVADDNLSMGQVVKGIHALPSVTPQVPRWIPLTKRPMTDEEREHYFEYTDMRIDDTYTILDCPLPDDGQEVLVSWGGNVGNDVFIQDNEGCYFEGMDIDEVDAWMPLPKPYEPQERSEKE